MIDKTLTKINSDIEKFEAIINKDTKWRNDYNFNHPHKSLGRKSPKEFLSRFDDRSEQNRDYLSNLEVS